MKIAIARTGYVGLSLALLLSQHKDVVSVDILSEKVMSTSNLEGPIKHPEFMYCDDELDRKV